MEEEDYLIITKIKQHQLNSNRISNNNFDTFKENVSNLVKEIVLNHLESRGLSVEQYMRLHDLGFLYIPKNPIVYFMNLSIIISRQGCLGSIEPYLSNEEVYNWINLRYSQKFEKASVEQKEALFNDAVNEIWSKCLYTLKGISEFRNYNDWDRNYPMINPQYRI